MAEHDNCTEFTLSVNARHDGTLEAAYIKLRDADVAWTKELQPSVLLVDFDADNTIVGVEILAPVAIADVLALAESLDQIHQEHFRNFIKSSAPPALVHA